MFGQINEVDVAENFGGEDTHILTEIKLGVNNRFLYTDADISQSK